MTAMISLGANYRICLRACVCATELEEGNVCLAHPSVSVLNRKHQLDNRSVFTKESV